VGLDDCDLGLLCWQLDENGHGTCIPMCTGTLDQPMCEEGLICDISPGELLAPALQARAPLAPRGDDRQIVRPDVAQRVRSGDASGDVGAYGEPCEYLNVCDLGLLCVASANVPGCVTAGCCTPYCDLKLMDPQQCPGWAQNQECLAFFPMGEAPPGLEDVGLC